MSDTHLFLLVPNDSGSTWLQNAISLCRNCVSFDTGLDGKGVCAGTDFYPDQEINKLFSEREDLWGRSSSYNWEKIKDLWFGAWSCAPNYNSATPRVFLEKTPQAIYASDMYVANFSNVRFVISIRNPYAVIEGMRRTIGNVSLERCTQHWVRCAKRQMYNIQKYSDISVTLSYELLLARPELIANQIRAVVPALHDLDFSKAASAHSIDGGVAERKLVDYNERQIANLSLEDLTTINTILGPEEEVMEYFGYSVRPKR